MSTITQLICNNFGGIRRKNAVFSDELITASDMQNVELYFTGINNGVGIRTAKGNISICDLLKDNERIINIFESVQRKETNFFVHTVTEEEGKFYLYDKELNLLFLKKDGLSTSDVSNGFDLVQGYSDLFFFTNGDNMFTIELPENKYNVVTEETPELDEIVSMDNIESRLIDEDENPVIVKGIIACVFDNRLFIAKDNILFWSVKANIYDFSSYGDEWETSAGYDELIKNITALYPYLGSLAIFHKDSSELLTVSSGSFSRGDSSPGGCAGFDSLIFHGTDLFFYDDTKKGVFSFKQVVNGDKTLSDNIAIDIQSELIDLDPTQLDKIKTLSVVLADRNEIWWILPKESKYTDVVTEEEKDASIILIFDYLNGEWVKRKSQKINSVRMINNELYSAGDNGTILKEYTSNTFNGDYIPHFYNCSPCNLGANNTLKVLAFQPRVSFNMPYTNSFKVRYIKNFDIYKKPKIKLIKPRYKNVLIWDKGYWDINYFAGDNTNCIGKFPSTTFKVLEIIIYTDNSNQDFSIRNIEFSKIKVKQV